MSNNQRIKRIMAKASRALLIYPIKLYQFFLSPWVGQHCRFEPSCSNYALEAIQEHGCCHGSWLTIKRLARCHPWCEGGYDPILKTVNKK